MSAYSWRKFPNPGPSLKEGFMKTRRAKIGTAVMITLLAAQPAAAWAASTVSGSYRSYLTDGKSRDSDNYAGPTGGRIRLCADQQGSVTGLGGSIAWIKRDVSGLPDTTNSSMIVEGGNPPECTDYTSSSSNAHYYTKVLASVDHGGDYTGWAKAEKP
jgi:hypothetical protein